MMAAAARYEESFIGRSGYKYVPIVNLLCPMQLNSPYALNVECFAKLVDRRSEVGPDVYGHVDR